jgi:hypothetical protein
MHPVGLEPHPPPYSYKGREEVQFKLELIDTNETKIFVVLLFILLIFYFFFLAVGVGRTEFIQSSSAEYTWNG